MKPLAAMRIVTATGARVLGRAPFGQFTSVSTDTRTLESGALFIALRGENHDGHAYLNQAAEKGALAVMIDEDGVAQAPPFLPCYVVPDTLLAYGSLAQAYRRQFDIPVIGVTGTVGKTTTKGMIAAVLGSLGPIVATQSNFNNEIGVPQTLFRMDEDTRGAVVEMGMRAEGEIAYLARMAQPTGGVITSIGKTHAEFFSDGEAGIASAKAELLDEMPSGAPAALPAESRWAMLLQRRARGPVTTFGLTNSADVRAEEYRLENGHSRFRIVTPRGSIEVRLPAPGRHLARNAAAAFCVALWHDIPLETAASALENLELGSHRLQVKEAPGGFTILDDAYNAGPESMRAALEVLRDWPAGRRIAVLGDMRELGEDAAAEHRALSTETTGLDYLVTIGDLGRLIGEAAPVPAEHAKDTDTAARLVLERIGPGDVVVIKGSRALELERIVDALAGAQSEKSHGS